MIEIVSFPRSGSYLLKAVIELTWKEKCIIAHRLPDEPGRNGAKVVYVSREMREALLSFVRQRKWWGLRSPSDGNLRGLGYFHDAKVRELLTSSDPDVRLVEVQADSTVDMLLSAQQPFDWWERFHELTLEEVHAEFQAAWVDREVPGYGMIPHVTYEDLTTAPDRVMDLLAPVLGRKSYVRYPTHRVGRFILGEQYIIGS